MRKCEFKTGKTVGTTSDWQPGVWHQWAQEGNAEDGSCPCGVIELPDGTIKVVYAEMVRFPSPPCEPGSPQVTRWAIAKPTTALSPTEAPDA